MYQVAMAMDAILKEIILMSKKSSIDMSFCVETLFTKDTKKASPVATPTAQLGSPIIHRKTCQSIFVCSNKVAGSMTVEAAFVIPFLLFFVANLLSLFLMYESYCINLANLHQKTKFIALASYGSSDDDVATLIHIQKIAPIFEYFGFTSASVVVDSNIRKWTGYNNLSVNQYNEIDEYVYITDNGRVFHRSRSCSHLKITMSIIDANDIRDARNENGERYKKCDYCCRNGTTGILFITNQGNKYHTNANCSGLKRSVKTVNIKDVGGRPPCSTCGG